MAAGVVQKNSYELTVVIKTTIKEKALESTIEKIEALIKNGGGEIMNKEEPLQRRLTYRIQGLKEGFFIVIKFNSTPELPNTIKRSIAIMDEVLRQMIVKLES